jgi:hypothetical protein
MCRIHTALNINIYFLECDLVCVTPCDTYLLFRFKFLLPSSVCAQRIVGADSSATPLPSLQHNIMSNEDGGSRLFRNSVAYCSVVVFV